MKIKLKLTTDELLYLEKKTYYVTGVHINDLPRDKKAQYTIMLDVADKVSSRAKSLARQLPIRKKKYDVSLKWHEAETLELFINGLMSSESDVYDSNLLRKMKLQINQKLA